MLPLRSAALVVFALVAFSSEDACQLTVGPPTVSPDFLEISDAIDAAPVGETIFVWPGTYDAFTVNRGVTILNVGGSTYGGVAVPAGDVVITNSVVGIDPINYPQSVIGVIDLAGDEACRLSGLTIGQHSVDDSAIKIQDCGGRVELVGLTCVVEDSFGYGRPALRVDCSYAVVVSHCYLRGVRATEAPFGYLEAGAAAEFYGSWVSLSSSVLLGGSSGGASPGARAGAAPGLIVWNDSIAEIARTFLRGGDAVADTCQSGMPYCTLPARAGLEVRGSDVTLKGGPGAAVLGGWGYEGMEFVGGVPTTDHFLEPASAVTVDALFEDSSVLRIAPDVSLVPGLWPASAAGTPPPPAVDLPGVGEEVTFESLPGATLQIHPAIALPGDLLEVSTSGVAGAAHLVFVRSEGILPINATGGRLLHLDPVGAILLTFVLDGSGFASQSVPVPADATLSGTTYLGQGVDFGQPEFRVTNPALLSLR